MPPGVANQHAVVSMATRHPDAADAEYLRWHTLDHRPEQHRLPAVRASLRLVSTPACRSARAISDGPLNAVDHVMTYFFSDRDGLRGFYELATALGSANRKVPLLPPVERGVYEVHSKAAARRVKVGSECAALAARSGGVFAGRAGIGISQATAGSRGRRRCLVGGVAQVDAGVASAQGNQSITYCFVDDNPVATAEGLRPVLNDRWANPAIEPLFAAPFSR